MASQYDLEILIRTKKQGDGLEQAGKEAENFGKRLNSTLETINKSVVAAAAAGATFQKAFELSKEGAEIIQLRDSFELMNEQVFMTPDLLDRMTSAVRGTIAETDLMRSLLTLTAGASNEAAQSYAAAIPQLLEIAKASNKLNPALGSTTELFDSLALGIKRGSPLILDNLGLTIKVGEANEKYAASIGKTTEQLTAEEKQMALLNATLEAGDQLIQQVGGNVESSADAWARLDVQVQESKEGLQQWLATGLLPVIEALSGGYGDQVEQMIDNNIATAKSFDELVAEAQKIDNVNTIMGGFGTTVTGTSRDVREGLIDVTRQLAGTADGFGEFEAVIESWSGKSRNQFYSFLRAQNLTVEEFYEQEKAAYAVSQAIEVLVPQTTAADEIMLRYAGSTQQAAVSTEELAAAAAGADAVLLQNYGNIQQVEQGWEELAAAQQRVKDLSLVDAFKDAADPINELIGAQQALAESEGEWVQRTVSTAGQITAVNAKLASDLSDDQADAYRDILRTVDEGSAEWLAAYSALQNDLTQSQRDALIAQRADLAAQPDYLVDVYTGDSEAAEEAQARISAANEAIKQSYRETAAEAILAQNGVNAATLELLVGIGYLTEEQAAARLEFANTTTAIQELTSSTQFNKLTVEEQTAALNALINGEQDTAAEAINLAQNMTEAQARMQEAKSAALGLAQELEAIPNEIAIHYSVTSDPFPAVPTGPHEKGQAPTPMAAGGSFSAGQMFEFGEGNKPELMMFKRDRRLFALPGNDGAVFGNAESQGILSDLGSGAGTKIEINISGMMLPPDPRAAGGIIAGEVAHRLGVK